MYVLTLIFTAILVPIVQAQTADVCDARFEVISSLMQSDCPENELDEFGEIKNNYYLFQDGIHGCFPQCLKVKSKMDNVNKTHSCEGQRCPPGYDCEKFTSPAGVPVMYCVLDVNSCFKYHLNYSSTDNAYYEAKWKPKCKSDGTWEPKQCKGEVSGDGRCFCYDPYGKRIDGHQWISKAENMTCACSRRRWEMLQDPKQWFVSLHCDDEGNYEPLQCNDEQCWCVETKTGDVISNIVPDKMWMHLPCYDEKLNGKRYLRQCESHQYAQKKIERELHARGTIGFKFQNILCDYDGQYGIYEIKEQRATCIWKDKKPLGGFIVDLTQQTANLKDMNCNCARDLKIYQIAGYDPERRGACGPNGNYNKVQAVTNEEGITYRYCVDLDGFRKSNNTEEQLTDAKCDKYQ